MQQPPPVSTAVDGALSVRELLLGIQNSKFVIITISSVNMLLQLFLLICQFWVCKIQVP